MRIFYNFASNCSTSQSYNIVVMKFKNNDGNQWEKGKIVQNWDRVKEVKKNHMLLLLLYEQLPWIDLKWNKYFVITRSCVTILPCNVFSQNTFRCFKPIPWNVAMHFDNLINCDYIYFDLFVSNWCSTIRDIGQAQTALDQFVSVCYTFCM